MTRSSHIRRHRVALFALALGAAACATPPPSREAAPQQPVAAGPPVLSETGRQYLEDLYVFSCSPGALPYRSVDPPRSTAEWEERRTELKACVDETARTFLRPEAVDALTWNGTSHSIPAPERRGLVEFGRAFLEQQAAEELADLRPPGDAAVATRR
ncbi:MAG: hypothetical protein ACQGVC_17180 [Myxococcota bacterium]